ncbi:hypothetical protein [Ornithinimicrobium kibberense]|uniref:hypothetical protein n=1 Tax=Ornithinimicrobium kibberense TaxID=282060 RepID=UPI0036220EB9
MDPRQARRAPRRRAPAGAILRDVASPAANPCQGGRRGGHAWPGPLRQTGDHRDGEVPRVAARDLPAHGRHLHSAGHRRVACSRADNAQRDQDLLRASKGIRSQHPGHDSAPSGQDKPDVEPGPATRLDPRATHRHQRVSSLPRRWDAPVALRPAARQGRRLPDQHRRRP